jgi:Fic family protein
MAFNPKYIITHKLLANIKKINSLIQELNNKRFPHVILFELEKAAREVSTYASTSIEGNPLPLTEVKKILKSKPQNIKQSEQEVLNYNQALKKLNNKLKKGLLTLNLNLILNIHYQIMGKLMDPNEIGKLRTKPVVINNPQNGQIVYLPPEVKDVKPLVKELLDFVHQKKEFIDPLIIAGIFHKQFVIIHPFMDGNGRTCRLATKVLLAQIGLNTFNLFSFENYYNKNVTHYFQKVGLEGNYYDLTKKIGFTEWLEYFTEGIIDELLRVEKILSTSTVSPQDELQAHHKIILDFIKKKGFITNKDYAQLTQRAKATRVLDFQKLIKMNLIVKKGKGRATYYQFNPLKWS